MRHILHILHDLGLIRVEYEAPWDATTKESHLAVEVREFPVVPPVNPPDATWVDAPLRRPHPVTPMAGPGDVPFTHRYRPGRLP